MFKGFMDESGISSESLACVVAGFAGKEKECDDIAEQWAEIVAPICEFHAVHFFPRVQGGRLGGIYKTYPVKFVEDIVIDLINLLASSTLEPIGLALNVDEFRSLSEDERRWLTSAEPYGPHWKSKGSPNTPYFVPFNYCLNQANDYTPEGETIYLTFDRQQDYEDAARKVFNSFRKMGGKWGARLGKDLAYSSRFEAVLLQAADLLAYVIGWSVTKEDIWSDIAKMALEKLAWGREFVRIMDRGGLDRQLQACPFRKTFWPGMTEPDFIEQIRASGINVLAHKGDVGVYVTHHIKPRNVKVVGALDVQPDLNVNLPTEKRDSTSDISVSSESGESSPQTSHLTSNRQPGDKPM